MNYDIFDSLESGKTRNAIIAELLYSPKTFEQLVEITKLDRTTIQYHISQLENQNKVEKRYIRRIAYIGLLPEYRKSQQTGEKKL